MQSSFEVLEWESTSKEQDLLIKQLFGDTKDTSIAAKNEFHTRASKREKRKVLGNDGNTEKPKKRKKDKRQKNKFKRDQKPNFQLEHNRPEPEEDADKSIYSMEKPEEKRVKKKFKRDQQLSSQVVECRGLQYGSIMGEPCDEFKSINSGKELQDSTSFDSADKIKQTICIESKLLSSKELNDENVKSSSNEPVEYKRKKGKKKRKEEKRKNDNASNGDCHTLNKEQVESNHKHIRSSISSDEEWDYSKLKKNATAKSRSISQDLLIPSFPTCKNKSSLYEKMSKQLESSRFRWINEQLYTTTGDEAAALFSKDPDLFDVYHRGFTNQVKLWPINPVDKIIQWLKKRPPSQVVADFGCGEALIARSVTNTVHSFDLVAKNKFVTACNMAKVPLNPSSVDVAVFCLSLMGTNLVDFLREAHRVLKSGGVLKIAEVTSRISETAEFIKSLSRLGFKLESQDTSNKMFVLFDFVKDEVSVKATPTQNMDGLILKPCIYKKR